MLAPGSIEDLRAMVVVREQPARQAIPRLSKWRGAASYAWATGGV